MTHASGDDRPAAPSDPPEHDRPPPESSRGVYGIGVTSELVGTGVQNLRAYERAGLVDPRRTPGGTRLYSPDDVVRLRRVQLLLTRGLNLVGIAMVLELEDDNQRLRQQSDQDGPVGADPNPG